MAAVSSTIATMPMLSPARMEIWIGTARLLPRALRVADPPAHRKAAIPPAGSSFAHAKAVADMDQRCAGAGQVRVMGDDDVGAVADGVDAIAGHAPRRHCRPRHAQDNVSRI